MKARCVEVPKVNVHTKQGNYFYLFTIPRDCSIIQPNKNTGQTRNQPSCPLVGKAKKLFFLTTKNNFFRKAFSSVWIWGSLSSSQPFPRPTKPQTEAVGYQGHRIPVPIYSCHFTVSFSLRFFLCQRTRLG